MQPERDKTANRQQAAIIIFRITDTPFKKIAEIV
jgi:hypothetical protein